jgi:hypothetical protein
MKNSVVTLAIDTHRETPMVSKNFERERGLNGKQQYEHGRSKVAEVFMNVSNNELRNIINPLDDFGYVLQKVHIHAQIGCVSVTFASSNEEIKVVLHLHRRYRQPWYENESFGIE